MKNNPFSGTGRGFTLVELSVTCLLVLVVAALVFMFTRTGMSKASSSNSLSRLRESGFLLLADAQEKNGRFQYALDDTPRDSPFLPYNIIRKALGVQTPGTGVQNKSHFCEIMHWDSGKLKPSVYHRNCFGVNFTDKPGVNWTNEIVSIGDQVFEVHTLIAATVNSLNPFALLVDSSDFRGNEIFRIHEGENGGSSGPANGIKPHAQFPRRPELPTRVAAGYVGLRNSGKAHAFFLDGSARALSPPDLKNEGFTKAYDNSTTPPVLKSL